MTEPAVRPAATVIYAADLRYLESLVEWRRQAVTGGHRKNLLPAAAGAFDEMEIFLRAACDRLFRGEPASAGTPFAAEGPGYPDDRQPAMPGRHQLQVAVTKWVRGEVGDDALRDAVLAAAHFSRQELLIAGREEGRRAACNYEPICDSQTYLIDSNTGCTGCGNFWSVYPPARVCPHPLADRCFQVCEACSQTVPT